MHTDTSNRALGGVLARGAPDSIQELKVGCIGVKVQHPREGDDYGHPLPRDMETLLNGDTIHSID